MEYQRFADTLVLRVDRGQDMLAAIENACVREHITLGQISGIGAMDMVRIGLYRVEERQYDAHSYHEMLEMTSLDGNVTQKDGHVYLHLHANFGRADGSVIGGHLNEAIVGGTAEIFIRILDGTVNRLLDEKETGLNLFAFPAPAQNG